MELAQYFSILRKWYRLILAAPLLAGVAALVVSFVLPRTYQAEADIAIVTSGAQVNFGTQIQTVSDLARVQTAIDQTARRNALTTIAKSPDIATAVIAKIGDHLDASQRIPNNLLGSIDAVNSGDLIKITAKADSAEKAALIANTWAQEYEPRANAAYGDNPLSPAEVQPQADAAKSDYDQKEGALIAYVRDNPIDDLARQIEQKKQSLSDLVTIGNKIERLQADAKSLRDRLSSGAPGSGRGDELAGILLEASAFSTWSNLPVSLQIPIDQLSTGSTPADQLRNLDALTTVLEDRRKTVQAGMVGPLQQEVNQLQAQLEQENAKKQELTRSRDLAWSTYTTLSNKVAEVKIAEQAKGSVVRVAVLAVPPDQPIAPKKTLNTLLAAVVGLMLGVGTAFLLEYLNNNVKTEQEVGTLLGLTIVGSIPELPRVKGNGIVSANGSGALAVQDPRSATTEAFRLLRHNLFADRAGGGSEVGSALRVLLIASALPAEGKSTVAANLALLLARSDKKVILVDADLRHASQHRIFGLKNGSGLVNILLESAGNWESYAQATEVKNLSVITAGPPPADPPQLLESPALGSLIEKLKGKSDIVIIDTSAVLGLADAAGVARFADAILMVIESDGVSRGDAVRAKELLSSTGVPIIGAVMNRSAELPGAWTYSYYASSKQTAQASTNGHKGVGAVVAQAQNVWWPGVRNRVVDWVGPRRGV